MIIHKTSTSGNDFVIVSRKEFLQTGEKEPDFAIKVCAEEEADGVIFYSPAEEGADFRIVNSDGSGAEISGNGMAGLASVLFATGICKDRAVLNTTAGTRIIELIEQNDPLFRLRVDMGLPDFKNRKFFPFLAGSQNEYDYRGIPFYPVSTGNPHAVVILEQFPEDTGELVKQGGELEAAEIFPMRTNVEFVLRPDSENREEVPLIRTFFYERGAGVTPFSSTGTTAVFSVLHRLGLIGDSMKMETGEGPVPVMLKDKILIESSTQIVYKKEYPKDK